MSSGTKRCALGVHCFIFKFHIYDRSRVDWTEIQDSDEKWKVTTLMGKVNCAAGETLHLAEDVRVELDYLAAQDGDGRYRCVVMLVLVLDALSYIPYIHDFFFFLRRVLLLWNTYTPYIHASFLRSLFAARATPGGQRAGGPPALRRNAFGAGERVCC